MITILCKRVVFYSQNDESAFFDFLGRIEAVESIVGEGDAIILNVIDKPSDESLRDLIALFHRYQIPEMTQLAQFLKKTNKKWFSDDNAYWYRQVFEN